MNKHRYITTILFFIFWILLSFYSTAQKIRSLSIDDLVPDIEFKLVNSEVTKAKLSDFKGKLIILDFWSTSCGGCITKLPKIDSVQNQFKDRLQVIMVDCKNTRDNEAKVKTFLTKWKAKYPNFSLPSAVEDTVAFYLFKHSSLPHYVWIGTNRKVKAITSAKEITAENIEKILHNEATAMTMKKDFFNDRFLELADNIPINNIIQYSTFIKGKQAGLKTVNQLRTQRNGGNEIRRGIAMRNMTVLEMYQRTYARIRKDRLGLELYEGKRTILEVTDSSKLIAPRATGPFKDNWEKENLYTYDLFVPMSDADSLYSYIFRDLNHYSGYYGRIEKRKVKCLALIRTSKEDKIKTGGGQPEYELYQGTKHQYIKNYPVSQFVLDGLNRISWITMPVFDETGYTGNIDIEFTTEYTDLKSLREALKKFDLDLQEEERELEMFVLTEKGYEKPVQLANK